MLFGLTSSFVLLFIVIDGLVIFNLYVKIWWLIEDIHVLKPVYGLDVLWIERF